MTKALTSLVFSRDVSSTTLMMSSADLTTTWSLWASPKILFPRTFRDGIMGVASTARMNGPWISKWSKTSLAGAKDSCWRVWGLVYGNRTVLYSVTSDGPPNPSQIWFANKAGPPKSRISANIVLLLSDHCAPVCLLMFVKRSQITGRRPGLSTFCGCSINSVNFFIIGFAVLETLFIRVAKCLLAGSVNDINSSRVCCPNL